jgi:hypothetical protein
MTQFKAEIYARGAILVVIGAGLSFSSPAASRCGPGESSDPA